MKKYVVIILTMLLTTPSLGRSLHHHHHHHAGGGGGRPHAWCGWYMRQLLHVADSSYNLARNWAHFGRMANGPHVGAIVVWAHHVGKIVGGGPGRWVVLSGNDGHRVRERARSVSGAIAFRDPS